MVGTEAGGPVVNREVQAIILLALAVVGLTVSFTGAYAAYVKPSLLPYLVVSCLALVVLAIAPYVAEMRQAARSAGHDHADHQHGNRVAWLLLLPTLVLMLISPPALGANAAEGDSGVVSAGDLELAGLPPIPAGDPAEITLLDVGIRAGFPDVGGLAGRTVELVGFAEPRPDGGWYLTRISIACCAADALALKVVAQDAPAPAADTWVQVVGTIEETSTGQPPALAIRSLTEVPEPSVPYLLRAGAGLY